MDQYQGSAHNDYKFEDTDGEQMSRAQKLINSLEENLENPLRYFENCSYKEILKIKSFHNQQNEQQPKQNKLKSKQYDVYNIEADILLNLEAHYRPQTNNSEEKNTENADIDSEEGDILSQDDLNEQQRSQSSDSLSVHSQESMEVGQVDKQDINEDQEEENDNLANQHQDQEQILISNLNQTNQEVEEEQEEKNDANLDKQMKQMNDPEQAVTIEEVNKEEDIEKTCQDIEEPSKEYQNIEPLDTSDNKDKVEIDESLLKNLENFDQTNKTKDFVMQLYQEFNSLLIYKGQKQQINKEKAENKNEQQDDYFSDLNEFYKNHIYYNELEQIQEIDTPLKIQEYLIQNLDQALKDFMEIFTKDFAILKKQEKQFSTDFYPKEFSLKIEKLQFFKQFFQEQLVSLISIIKNQQKSFSKSDIIFCIFLFIKSLEFEMELYQKQLPSYSSKNRLQKLIFDENDSKVSLLMGETGSGKSTQVPQMLFALNNLYLKSDYLSKRKDQKNIILCVQPRRLACKTLYYRVKSEMNDYGHQVGYYIGNLPKQQDFQNKQIIFVTEQVFINLFVNYQKIQRGLLTNCSHIIIDEVHERNLKTDVIIGLIHRCLENPSYNKGGIKFLLSSATINQESFEKYFSDYKLKLIKIIGRTYQVKVEYLENTYQNESMKNKILNQLEKIIDSNKRSLSKFELQGHILIFLQDQIEISQMIESTQQLLKSQKSLTVTYAVYQLHGKLSQSEIQKVFEQNERETKIIFSTNIAEASITIEGIGVVIDSGKEKTNIFDPSKNSNVLTVQNISKSQAEQRRGRAGRTREGICYRLYTEKEYQDFQKDKIPEIQRSNLGFVILKIIQIGVQNINEFQFLSKPSQNLIQNSLDTLQQLGAIEIIKDICKLTDIGKCIIKTDLEPTIARILIQSLYLGVQEEVIKALAVQTEYNSIFSFNRDLVKQILDDYRHQGGSINQFNSDFIFMWITYDYLDRIIHNKREKKYYFNQNLKSSFKKIKEYYEETQQQVKSLVKHVKMRKLYYLRLSNTEILQITKKEQFRVVDSPVQKYEKIVQSFFSGYPSQLAVYTGIHKLGFLNLKTNALFYVHPSSSLNQQQTNKQVNRKFDKGQIIFFSVLEEREINNFARFVSIINPDWIQNEQTRQKLEDKSNFQPYIKLYGERPLLDHFSRNQYFTIQKQLESMVLPKKAKFCVLFEKELGYVHFYCNSEMQPYMDMLNLNKIFDETKVQYQEELKKEQIIVRYQDSLNYAIIKNGLQIKKLILPHEFLRVTLTNIPFKVSQKSIKNFLQFIQYKLSGKSQFKEFKIIKDYINQTAIALFIFKNTKRANAFYDILTKISTRKIAELLQAEDNQLPQIVPESECHFYIQQMKNQSKTVIRAQWSLTESLCHGFMYFSNEIDALSTFDQIKNAKVFKVKYQVKEDTITDNIIHILLVDKLNPLIDEIDLESYVINNYQGFISCEVKRQKMDSSMFNNLAYQECIQKKNLIDLIGDTINQFNYLNASKTNKIFKGQKGQQQNQESKNGPQIYLRIHNGICKAEIALDSLLQAQELVNKFDGVSFEYQKLRMQLQNQQMIQVLGSVYQLYYDNIKQYIEQAGQAVQVVAPKYKDIIFQSKNVTIKIKQVNQNGNIIFQKLNFQLKNIIKPDFIYFDSNPHPQDIEDMLNKQYKIVQTLQKEHNCIINQSGKRSSQLRVWFRKESTDRYIKISKQKIKNELEKYLLQKLKFQKQNPQKQIEKCLKNMQKQNIIESYEIDNKIFTVKAQKNQIKQVKQEIKNLEKRNLNKQKSDQEAQEEEEDSETCKICQEVKNLQRMSCGCLFCKDCIHNFFLTQSQEFQSRKPLACPDHQDQPVSIKLITSIFGHEQLQELIQLRIGHSIENMTHPTLEKPAYIRCPSVNCNQFFERIYASSSPESQKNLSEEGISTQDEMEEIPSTKNSSKIQEQIQITEIYGKAPSRVKCYGCFQEYCLLSSGINFEVPEKQIHNIHTEKTCDQYFSQLELESENLKGIQFIECPKCHFKATKGEGCNHISCKCGAHFCAKCEQLFKTSKDVYLHLDEVHQGYYN